MFSRDFMRREMPVDIDVEDEGRKIDIEDMEDAAKQAMMAYAQAIPMLATNGQDASKPLEILAQIISDRRKGRALVDSIVDAFAPEEPKELPAAEQSPEALLAAAGITGTPGMPGEPMPGEAAPAEAAPTEGQQGQPGAQQAAPAGPPDIMALLAGLGGGAPVA
jgi:hypothetical protein